MEEQGSGRCRLRSGSGFILNTGGHQKWDCESQRVKLLWLIQRLLEAEVQPTETREEAVRLA